MIALFAHDHRFIRVGDQFFSRGGLPQEVLERYANHFGELRVICRTESQAETILAPINHPAITFIPQTNIRSLGGLSSIHAVRRSVARAVSKADVVISRLPSSLGWLAQREANLQKKPYLIEVVGNAQEAARFHGSPIGTVTGKIEDYLTKTSVRDAEYVAYITKSYLQSVYPTQGRAFVCPTVRINACSEAALEARLCSKPREIGKRIGLIGSLDVNYKGHGTAIEVLASLVHEHGLADLTLEFAGGGGQARWQSLAHAKGVADQICFRGSIPSGTEMENWIDSMDLILQPSSTEAQGRAIIEAMSRGCPVVATRVGGIPELIEDNWLIAPGDAQGAAKLCVELFGVKARYDRTVKRNWLVAQNFRSEVIDRARREAFEVLSNAAISTIASP